MTRKWTIFVFVLAVEAQAVLAVDGEGVIAVRATLRDASEIRGETAAGTAFVGDAVFQKGLSLPAALVESLEADGTNGAFVATLANGDRLHLALKTEALALSTMLGDLAVPFAKVRKAAFARQATAADGLIYYCTFDSREAIEHPAVVPAGTFLAGRFVEGKVGKALAVAPQTCAAHALIPAGFFGPKGCIEFWGRIDGSSDFPARFGGIGSPVFFDCHAAGEVWKLTVMWNSNNGVGHSGLCGSVQHYPAASDSHTGETFARLLGETIDEWHHYALVWNTTGIPSLGMQNGIATKVAVYLDGFPIATKTNVRNPNWGVSEFSRSATVLGFPIQPGDESFNKLPYTIDEFKVWNYDKVEF